MSEFEATKKRLRWCCREMIERINEADNDSHFGEISGLIIVTHELARSLGFNNPPVERVEFDGNIDYLKVGQKWEGNANGRRVGSGSPSFFDAALIKHINPDLLYAFGYRFFDPISDSVFLEFKTCGATKAMVDP